jgi:hypothetical protein
MSSANPIIFIGSGEASTLERKVLIHSLRKVASRPIEIAVFNGTHNTLEREGRKPELMPMAVRVKYLNITEFSNYRYLIPQLCGYQGRAIWLDSDMICLTDIAQLFDSPLDGADLMAKSFLGPRGSTRWGLSVSLFDCARCRFDLDQYADEIEAGHYLYNDVHQMTEPFLSRHPLRLARLDDRWNSYDEWAPDTKLIHYTNLHTQPWKVRGHRHGALWFRYFNEAREAGAISEADIELAIRRSYVRPDIRKGNTIGVGDILRNAVVDLKATLRDAVMPAQRRAEADRHSSS